MQSNRSREKAELAHWRDNEDERPGSDSMANLLFKMTDGYVFFHVIENYRKFFHNAPHVLELGGGQGWASCILKKLYPNMKISLTDISACALESKKKWERIFDVSVNAAYACTSYAIPLPANTVDVIFCFAAAHHFADVEKTMEEVSRILKSGGHCFFFHEPATSPLMYKSALSRVNKKRPSVPEDVIIYPHLLTMARKYGLKASIHFNPTLIRRGPIEMLYYYVLSKVNFLQYILPCTANFHFSKL